MVTNIKSAPDYSVVHRVLKEHIVSGHYAPGTWLLTQRELAEDFGVDRSAVRRALNKLVSEGLIEHRKGCRPLIRERIDRRKVSSPATSANNRIAAVAYHSEYFVGAPSLLKAASRSLYESEQPFGLLVIDTNGPNRQAVVEKERMAMAAIRRGDFAGALVWYSGDDSLPDIVDAINAGATIVFVDVHPETIPCDFVGIDDWQAGYDAGKYLVSLGHRKIALVTQTNEISSTRGRKEGFLSALKNLAANDNPIVAWVEHVEQSMEDGVRQQVDYMLSLPNRPTAVFAITDYMAFTLIQEFESRGLSVPGDISIMGCDHMERHLPTPRRLTTMHIPFDTIGYRAAKLLQDRLLTPNSHDAPRQHIMLAATLVEGITCGRL